MRDAALLRRPVDLGHQRLQHRRTGRHFGHLDARAVALGDRQQALPHLLGDLVALQLALALAEQVHLDVGHVRPAAQVVVAHQAVEVVRRGRADVGLEVDHLRLLQRRVGQLAARPARSLPAWCRSGMSTITWNSLLLSKGSIFTLTNSK